MKHLIALCLIAFMAVCVSPAPAQANIFNDAQNWADGAADTVREGLEKAAKAVQDSAKYVAKKTSEAAVKVARAADREFKKAVAAMSDFLSNLGSLGADCKAMLNHSADAMADGWPRIDDPVMATQLPQLGGERCVGYQVSGFSCGIFPYLKRMVVAIAQGQSDVKRLSQYVARANDSAHCRKAGPGRPACALVLGIADMSRESGQCMANVARTVVEDFSRGHPNAPSMPGKPSLPSISAPDEEKLCNQMGELAFSYAADKLAVVAASSHETLQKTIRFSQTLREALRFQSRTERPDIVKRACEDGAETGMSDMLREDRILNPLRGPNPGAHLLLMTSPDNAKCVQFHRRSRMVTPEDCTGTSDQRWSFHDIPAHDGWVQLWNDDLGPGSCLQIGSLGETCDVHNPRQAFRIVDGGKLQNWESKKCLTPVRDIRAERDKLYPPKKNPFGGNQSSPMMIPGLGETDCDKAQAIYYEDPASYLVSPDPGAHLQLYAYPSSPMCLSWQNKGEAVLWNCQGGSYYQKWSFHADGQIWNDKHGPGSCLTSPNKKGAQMFVSQCRKGHPAQKFKVLSSGQIQNERSGMCVDIRGNRHGKHTPVIEWRCKEAGEKTGRANQEFYVLQ